MGSGQMAGGFDGWQGASPAGGGGTSFVNQLIAGSGIALSPPGGTGVVTVSTTDTLASLYIRALSPPYTDADNTLVGSYFSTFFADNGGVQISQTLIDNGSGADSNSPILSRRYFSNQAAAGLIEDYRVRYNPGTLDRGGLQKKYTVEDQLGGTLLYAVEREGLTNGAVFANYRPTFAGGILTTEDLDMIGLTAAGTLTGSVHGRNGNGLSWQRVVMTDSARDVGGHIMIMNSENGGFPVDGSSVGLWVTGPTSTVGLGAQLMWFQTVVDTGNFGSERASTHADLWLGQNSAEVFQKAMAFYPGQFIIKSYGTTQIAKVTFEDGTASPVSGADNAALAYIVGDGDDRLKLSNNAADYSPVMVFSDLVDEPTDAETITIDNAPTGTGPSPARYFTMPDGAGGVYTLISLT